MRGIEYKVREWKREKEWKKNQTSCSVSQEDLKDFINELKILQ